VLGLMLQLEKEINWSLRLSPIFSTGFTYSRTVACCGSLTSNQKVLIYTTHIKKVIAKLYSFTLRRKKWQKIMGQKFRRGQKLWFSLQRCCSVFFCFY